MSCGACSRTSATTRAAGIRSGERGVVDGRRRVLLALVGATLYLLRPVPAEWCLPLSPLALLALIVACVPAGMTSRQAERLLS